MRKLPTVESPRGIRVIGSGFSGVRRGRRIGSSRTFRGYLPSPSSRRREDQHCLNPHWIRLVLGVLLGTPAWGETPPVASSGELLVRLVDGGPEAVAGKGAVGALEELGRSYDLLSNEPVFRRPEVVARQAPGPGPPVWRWRRLRFGGEWDIGAAAARFARLAAVEEVQLNYLRRTAVLLEDSLYTTQWNLQAIGWERLETVEADRVLVAVIDSGLDYTHPDIAAQLWRNPIESTGLAGVDDDGNGYVDDLIGWDFTDAPGLPGTGDYREPDNEPWDESGHGTHVAGILAATVDNGIGIAGVARGVQLLPLRAGLNLDQGGFFEDDDLAAAIVYAADQGADVINMSWGAPAFSPLLREAVNYAAAAGCVLVAAAGNEGTSPVFVPARLAAPIAVAAAAADGSILSFSNPGIAVDMAAPGQGILSLVPGGRYGLLSGTSMAAPHVAGLAAMILARNPHFDAAAVRAALLATAIDLDRPGRDPRSGAGLVRAEAVFVDAPLGVTIISPASEAVIEGNITIRVRAGPGQADGTLAVAWGAGEEPRIWTKLLNAAMPRAGEIAVPWSVAELVPGVYTIRATGRVGTWSVDDLRQVRVAGRGPQPANPVFTRQLVGGSWAGIVEWTTDLPATGVVRVALSGERQPLFEVVGRSGERRHRLQLPAELPSAEYDIWIQVSSGSHVALSGPHAIELRNDAVGVWTLAPTANFAAGFAMPRLADLDGDSRLELALMPFGGGSYNPVQLHEYGGAGFALAHTTTRLFIPWVAGDLDQDGRTEIMAVDARRVRLLESSADGGYPDRIFWERDGVWGGEVGDLDDDGELEMILRSSGASLFEMLEVNGAGGFELAATLRNPTTGTNELAERQVLVDLDGDGRSDFAAVDDDGGLFVFEGIGDDAVRTTWASELPGGVLAAPPVDAALLGGGADLDGDGRLEFATGHFFRDVHEPARNRWLLSVYQSVGDNDYQVEWSAQVAGGQGSGNGISLVDLDGDGRLEIAAALAPSLYLFAATGVDHYEPVWYQRIAQTFRPASGDADGDGRQMLLANIAARDLPAIGIVDRGADRAVAFAAPGELDGLAPPGGFTALALDASTARLAWLAVAGANRYQVYRDGEGVASVAAGLSYIDSNLLRDTVYAYSVTALDEAGRESAPSTTVTVRPVPPPRIVAVEQLGRHQLAVHFDAAMDIDPDRTYLYAVAPDVGAPASVFGDQDGRRAVLGFATALPDSGRYRLEVDALGGVDGTPLAAADAFDFELAPVVDPVRLVAAAVRSSHRVTLWFSGSLRPFSAAVPGRHIEIDGGALAVRAMEVAADSVSLLLDLPLRPLGRRYEIEVLELEDERGLPVEGRLFVALPATDLAGLTVFPNPYDPRAGGLTVAGLPPDARVSIQTLSGQPVRELVEWDGDGGLSWDGRNQAGSIVGSGVYLYVVVHGDQVRHGRMAVVSGGR